MEQVGTQVAHPMFIHHQLPGPFYEAPTPLKKRDLPWQNRMYENQQQQQQQQQQQPHWLQNPGSSWDPKGWQWDSVRFVAKPSDVEVQRMGSVPMVIEPGGQRKEGAEAPKPVNTDRPVDEDGENLTLKLGGSLYSVEEPAARPNKRVRSGSPGNAAYPMCQVDDCKADLSSAKDYHRRHKVCEVHSKTTKALVGNQMQRFCQQCSRFHPLSEFDEGKRSCRRRLAGHNRRRRKTQPEDVSSRLVPGTQENVSNGNLDIVNLLSILTRFQGNNVDKTTNSMPDRNQVLQILNKINSSLPATTNPTSRFPVPGGFDLNVSQQVPSEQPNKMNGNTPAPSTTELLNFLSAAVEASSSDNHANLSRSSHSSNDDRIKLNCLDQAGGGNMLRKPLPAFQLAGGERSCTTSQSPADVSDGQVHEARPSFALQLFNSSPEEEGPQKIESARKYLSSESSNPMEERSLSSSSPIAQKLFPMHNAFEVMKHESLSTSREDNVTAEASTTHGWNSPLQLFKGSKGQAQHRPYQAGYASSSGSDRSPSSSNYDAQDRTGRIIFKLFDKDPSTFPGMLRSQILNWLSQCPSELESYIRPGCVVLSLYISMPYTAWDQLQESLLQRVSSLVQDSNSDFWRDGRFLVHTDRQLASHKDGKIHLCKSWRTWSSPELISVSPLAVVGGQKTSLMLRGRNLNVPGTKIYCTYMGGYLSKEVQGSVGTVYDDASSESFSFPGGLPDVLGRCFIEVENGFKGNSFPVIIADAAICKELRILESEFEEDARTSDISSDDQIQDFGRLRSREDILYFLNELGWLFQRKSIPSRPDCPKFSESKFKFLFLFSVERDWYSLVKTLLDIFVEQTSVKDEMSRNSLEMLSEIHLLNRAVKRKCRGMVDLLIHYSVCRGNDSSRKYIFLPNQAGPGGITPLHIAACTHDSETIVDALTNDPGEVGLTCWSTVLDANGQSPYDYASARSINSYNKLVARKIADKKHGQVSISVGDEILDQSWALEERTGRQTPLASQGKRSCIKCATLMTSHYRGRPSARGILHRPYLRSMLAVAAVCVCVCLFLRGSPDIGCVAPFKWENLNYGTH